MKKENWCTIILIIVAFTSFFIINKNVVYFGDDYYFLSFTNCNLNEYISKIITHYKLDNGRVIVHVFDTLCLKFPIMFWSVINSLMLTGICYFMAKIATNDDKNRMPIVFSVVFVLISSLDILITNQSVYWITGSFNYVYPILMLLIYWNFLNKIDYGKKYYVFAIIFAFLASASVEQAGMMAFGLTLLTMFEKSEGINKFFNRNKKTLFLLIVTLFGLLTVLLAPSQFVRMNSGEEIDIIERSIQNANFIIYQFICSESIMPYVILLNVLVFIFAVLDKQKNKANIFVYIFAVINLCLVIYCVNNINSEGELLYKTENILILGVILITCMFNVIWIGLKTEKNFFSTPTNVMILLIGSQFMMIISPVIGYRNLLAGFMMFIFLITLLISKIQIKNISIILITIMFMISGIVNNLETAEGYYENKIIDNLNIQTIESEKNNKIITLRKFENDKFCWSMPYNSEFHKMWYKKFYKIESEIYWE